MAAMQHNRSISNPEAQFTRIPSELRCAIFDAAGVSNSMKLKIRMTHHRLDHALGLRRYFTTNDEDSNAGPMVFFTLLQIDHKTHDEVRDHFFSTVHVAISYLHSRNQTTPAAPKWIDFPRHSLPLPECFFAQVRHLTIKGLCISIRTQRTLEDQAGWLSRLEGTCTVNIDASNGIESLVWSVGQWKKDNLGFSNFALALSRGKTFDTIVSMDTLEEVARCLSEETTAYVRGMLMGEDAVVKILELMEQVRVD